MINSGETNILWNGLLFFNLNFLLSFSKWLLTTLLGFELKFININIL